MITILDTVLAIVCIAILETLITLIDIATGEDDGESED